MHMWESVKEISNDYSKKSKNLRKAANVGDRRFPRPKNGLPRGVVSF